MIQLNRREVIKRGVFTAGVLAIAGPGILTQVACGSTKQLVKWAGVALGYLRDLLPILTDAGAASIVALVNRALPIAEKLKKALEDNDNVATFDALQSLTSPSGVIAQIAEEVGLITDPDRRRIILGVMAAVQLTIRLIAAQIQENVPVPTANAIRKSVPATAGAIDRAAAEAQLNAAFKATRF